MIRRVYWFLLPCLVFLAACAVQPASPATPSPQAEGRAAVWERSGGIAGICQRLAIQADGSYTLLDCARNQEVRAGALSAEQIGRLRLLLDQYPTHHYVFVPPAGSADMFTESYTLYGRGGDEPSPEEQVAINLFLASIADSFPPLAPTEVQDTSSGVEGQVWLGPTCPGPARQDAPECADKPYQAKISVLDPEGTLVAETQSDPSGYFRISLPPGEYLLRPESPMGSRLPAASEQNVTVAQGEYTPVEIRYDSGIR